MKQYKKRVIKNSQRGFALVGTLLALVVMGVITAGQIISQQTEAQRTSGSLQAQILMEISVGANQYVMENYPKFQNDLSVTSNGVTVAHGTDEGQTMSPTIANLVSMNYLSANTSNRAKLNDGIYKIKLEKIPAGCLPADCNITGALYIDKAILNPGTTEMAPLKIGAIMNRIGSDVAVALNTNPAILKSPSGIEMTNPVSVTAVGVVGHRLGFGSKAFGKYLIVRDPRDPDFQGNFTVAGNSTFNNNVTVNGNTTNTGSITAGGPVSTIDSLSACIRAGFEPGAPAGGGSAFVTNNACLKTVNLDGLTGVVSATGAVEVRSGGVVVATLRSDGTILATTRTEAPVAKLTASYAPNTACNASQANDVAQNSLNPGLVVCRNNIWVPTGLTFGVVGGVCSPNGGFGITTLNLGLFCQGGIWVANADRIGKFASQDSFVGHHGMLIDKPSCPSNGAPRIYFTPTGAEFSPAVGIRSTYFLTADLGAQWQLRVVDANGIAVPDGQGITTTGCWNE